MLKETAPGERVTSQAPAAKWGRQTSQLAGSTAERQKGRGELRKDSLGEGDTPSARAPKGPGCG